jgi:mannose-1-phosphate guanylyltransferase
VQAVVLVGGLGTRLRPLTTTIPKQLLPIAGVPMIERVLAHLAAHGVDRAVLSMGYLPDPFMAAYPTSRIGGVEVTFATEPEPLGTAGAIRFASRCLDVDETFLAVNGDVLTDLDVTALVARHRSSGAEGTLHLTPVEDPSRYGVVEIDPEGLVRAFVEKPAPGTAASNNINAGTYVLEPSFLERVEPDVAVSIELEVFPRMVAAGLLLGVVDGSYWLDAGTPPSYLRANLDVLDGTRAVAHPGALADANLVLDRATVDPSATIQSSFIASGVDVQRGATVRCSVVLADAIVGEGATVVDSIVGPGARIGAGASLVANCLVAQGAVVPDRAQLVGVPVAS